MVTEILERNVIQFGGYIMLKNEYNMYDEQVELIVLSWF